MFLFYVMHSESGRNSIQSRYEAKEGTILTVAKGAADKALDLAQETEDLVYFCDEVIKHADVVLSQNSGNASGLKAGRVVDSGGQGTGSGR